MNFFRHFLFCALIATLFSACEDDPETVPEGTVRLIINVNHHGYPIAHARIFRENGTMIYPGEDTTIYDARYVADANGNLTISDVGNGTKEIVLYALGFDPTWDTTIITPVSGYQMVRVITAIGESKDVVVMVPVSE